jgi:hypothetical protein
MLGLDSYVISLLHFDGPDNGTVFNDETGKRLWTPAGNAKLTTADKRFNLSSGIFDGTGDYLTTPDSADFIFGTADWTIDFWFKTTQATAGYFFYQGDNSGTANTISLLLYIAGSKLGYCPDMSLYPSKHDIVSTQNVNDGAWHHAAIIRDAGYFRMYVDGVATGTPFNGTTYSMVNVAQPAFIGSMGTSLNAYNGSIDEFRISTGIARWTATFIPPSAPYSNARAKTYLKNARSRFINLGTSLG